METNEERWGAMMLAAQKGDKVVYHALLSELSDSISSYLLSRFGPMPFLDDCVQESLLAIHKARETYESGRPFKPWLNAIVRYKTIDVMRKNRKHAVSRLRDEELLECEEGLIGGSLATDSAVEEVIYNAQLLAKLPRKNSEALVMTKYFGCSVTEAAEVLNISNMAVKQRVRRAILKARAVLMGDAL